MKKVFLSLAFVASALFCRAQPKTIGSIERLDPEVNRLIKKDAVIEVLGEGYGWSEGPVWVPQHNMLLFSDIPANAVYKWTEKKGVESYLKPSGYTGKQERGGEGGANGLLLTREGRLLLCQHGDRRIALMDASLHRPQPRFRTLAGSYQGKRFNSPNDAAIRSNGEVFFTDPPYGLEKGMEDPLKELPFQGVYKVDGKGMVTLLLDSISRPNGIGFTPDEKALVVANSDDTKAVWYWYDLAENGQLRNGRILRDVTAEMKTEQGAPDGFKFTRDGHLFATGPGGVWIFNKAGKVIGRIRLPVASANCAFSADERTLFITAHMYLLRVQLR